MLIKLERERETHTHTHTCARCEIEISRGSQLQLHNTFICYKQDTQEAHSARTCRLVVVVINTINHNRPHLMGISYMKSILEGPWLLGAQGSRLPLPNVQIHPWWGHTYSEHLGRWGFLPELCWLQEASRWWGPSSPADALPSRSSVTSHTHPAFHGGFLQEQMYKTDIFVILFFVSSVL